MSAFLLYCVYWISLIGLGSASHFYGGTIWLSPSGSGVQYTVTERTFWNGSTCSHCPGGASTCTETYSSHNWHICVRSPNNTSPTSYSYTGASWGGSWSGRGSWNLTSHVITATRADNGLINTPPVTNSKGVVPLEGNCAYSLTIPVYDADGDDVRCRFATGIECLSACDKLTGATLDSNTCTLSYTPPGSGNYLPVTIQVEDFYNTSSSTALSSIPLQFVIYHHTPTRDCSDLPEIITPTHQSLYCLTVNSQFDLNITARSSVSLSFIQVVKPLGMSIGSPSNWSISNNYYMSNTVTWTPSSTDTGTHSVCASADDSDGVQSVQSCVFLLVTTDPEVQITTRTLVHTTNGFSWTVGYNRQISKPTSTAFINIYVSSSGSLYSRIDVSSSGSIQFSSTSFQLTITGIDKTQAYYMLFDAGIVFVENCVTPSDPVTNQTEFVIPLTDCDPAPAAPSNGLSQGSDTSVGSVVVYSCSTGHTLSGNSVIQCTENGSWNGSAPTCLPVDCGALSSLANGNVTIDQGTTYQDTANYTCNAGFNINGTETRTCGRDGNWNGSAPTCSRKDCGTLSSPTNGNVNTDQGTKYQDTANYTCNAGFNLNGTETRTCGSDGNWNGSAPTCSRKDCGALSSPVNGNVNTDQGTKYQDTANYTCNAGFNVNGTETRTCGRDGNWNGSAPTCSRKDCGTLSSPTNGNVNTDQGTKYQDTANYTCNAGFNLNGTETRTCGSDGNWNGSAPTCSRKDCGALSSPVNGNVNTDQGTKYQDTANYTCNAGFNVNGTETRTCGRDGNWNGSAPTCSRKDCGTLSSPTNGNVNTDQGTKYQDTANYTCNAGFNLNGTETRTCGSDGNWNGSAPTCSRKDCGALSSPANGNVNTDQGTKYQDTANYTCNAGFNINGTETRTCGRDGNWNGSAPTCSRKDCGTLSSPTNGNVNTDQGTKYQDTANYTCNAGFNLNGTETRTCGSDGNWNGSAPTCSRKDCGALSSPVNGNVNTDQGTKYQDTANYTCNAGFNINGTETRTCGRDGNWNGSAPTCSRKDCGTLSSPTNGNVNTDQGTKYQDTANYTCNAGFNLNGTETRTCGSDGNWNGSAPTCSRKDCGALSSPVNGNVNTDQGTKYQDTANYTCNAGFNINGTETRTCGRDGNWNGSAPTCSREDCGTLSSPTNGNVNTDQGTKYQDTANYTCNAGFNLNGTETRTCGSDGNWNGSAPTCSRIDCGTLSSPTNGNVENDHGTKYQDTANYTCNAGFNINGTETRTCGSDGNWNGSAPTCSRKDCGALSNPANGNVNTDQGTKYQDRANYTCNAGFNINGTETRTCGSDGNWNGSAPTCSRKDCGALSSPANGNVNTDHGTKYQDTANYTCDAGFNINGTETRTCGSDGNWNGSAPTCSRKDCGALSSPANGNVNTDQGTKYQDTANYTCNAGFNINGTETRTCGSDGNWNGSAPTCSRKDCGVLSSPANGNVNTDQGTKYQDTANYTCNAGFNVNGTETRTCGSDGNWNGSAPTCSRKDCGALSNPANGNVNIDQGTKYQDAANYTCNAGFNINGTETRTCGSDGNWNGSAPTCSRKDCGALSSPANGNVNTDQGTKYQDTANYTCNAGFNINGTETRTCGSDGNWNGSAPTCSRKDCGPLESPTNGTVNTDQGTKFEDTAIYTCYPGFNLNGTETRTCGSDGNWNGSAPTCTKKASYGEACVETADCGTQGSVCVQGTCQCNKTGVVDLGNNLCDTMPLSNYGTAADTPVPQEADCSDPVTFPSGFTVFGNTYRSVYVCSNGYVSLDSKYSDPKPPNDTSLLDDFVVLAPYYSDTDASTRQVYYRSYKIDNNAEGLGGDDVTGIKDFLEQFGGQSGFQPAFALFVTWSGMQPFGNLTEGTATFQLVLVSDGIDTYALFIYSHGGMTWTTNQMKPDIWIGYHVTNDHSESSLLSFSRRALTMDQHANTKGVKGVSLHHLNEPEERVAESVKNSINCHRWYNNNYHTKFDYLNLAIDCPCDLTKLTLDPWYTGLVPLPGTSDIVCTTIWAARVFDPHGKSCCYNTTTSLWVQDRPYAGTFFSNHPVTHPKQHELDDLNAKTYCCNGSNLCEKYYELRPIGDCYRETWFGFGTFWGDPHFRTLDNKDFTFNGLGEYQLLHVEKEDRLFQLQARTERASKADGTLSNATVFSAFAAYDDGDGAKFQVELQNKTGFVVYSNNVDISLGIRQANYTYQASEGNLLITKSGETVLVLFPFFGISLNVTINIRTFSIVVLINSTFAGQTRGLLGNFNGNPDDDFVLPNGTVLDSNMTEREIFDYGQQWSVNETTTVFDYPRGKSHADFHVENHEPEFLDEASAEKRNIAEQFCSGGILEYSSNDIKQCIFDLVFTDDEDFANQTLITEDISVRDQKEINANIPNLEGCDVIRGHLDDFLSCKLNISQDPDELNFTVSGLDNFTLSEDGTLTFKLDDSDLVKVSVTNNDGKISPEVTLNFFLCNGCSGNGACSEDESRGDDSETEFFKLAQCICYTGYDDGPDCESNFDGCASKPCSLRRNCTDLSPDEHQLRNKPFECGPCPDGYIDLPTDKDKCVDKNECLENNGGCEQICTNTDGGYECSCWTGYRQNTNNRSACSDVNECDEALHQCEHTCINTDGDYICTCKQGFTLQSDTRTCLKDDIDVCSGSLIDCSEADGCTVNENGNASCFCNNGFALSGDNICEDIDECAASVCPQVCENTDGSFVCICYIGYELTEITTCTSCSFPTWGDDCANTCDCPDAIRCDPVKGCICRTGWTGTQCDEDINECQTLTDPCPNVLEECINTNGSYYCGCITGYQRLEGPDQNCKDIDECTSALLHDCQPSVAICNNAVGGYTCSCTQGYKELNATHCEDIDECKLGIAGCEHDCENFNGSFNCYCQFGYILLEDRKSCEEDENPCLTKGLNCTQVCITDVISRATSCGCSPGFELEEDNLTCSDIKECENATSNKCEGNAECKNEVGSYRCECSVGYKLQNDRRTCTECDQFHYGINCSNTCNCIRGVCNKITGCICDEGWFGPECVLDINECRLTEDLCEGDLLECVNTLGSYTCECLSGYQLINEICTDIDECKSSDTNDCHQICDNTVGGYLCRCQPGFIRGNDSCENINECDLQHDCEQNCQDTVGSYRCSCRSGFSLDLSDRKSCTPETECNETMITYCNVRNGDCLLIEGEPDCTCWKGYQKNEDTGECEDIDECLDDRCDQNCVNLPGNYSCTCNVGYQLDADLVTCTECLPFYYGQGCVEECICVRTKTDFCNHIDGLCNCKQGWRSEDCSIDINECKDDEEICNIQPNSRCVNENGSYKCVCNDGFYAGDNSCIDRDECQEDVDNCMQICENTEGSFYCDCFTGYYLNGSSCLASYGEACEETADCGTQGSVCVQGICQCNKTGVVDLGNNLCDTMPLSNYGTAADTPVPQEADCSDPVTFPSGFTVFGNTYRSVYVCSNGYISLGSKYSDPKPPNDTSLLDDFVVLAPYYSDTEEGTRRVYYRSYKIDNNAEGLGGDDVTGIKDFLEQFGGQSGFQPAFALFVTWSDMQPFGNLTEGTATFQLVLVSDGIDTYALYIYPHGGMTWTTNQMRPGIWIGYHVTNNHSESSLLSFSRQALTMDQHANTKGVKGVSLHHLNEPEERVAESVMNSINCHRWYNNNYHTKFDYLNLAIDCPCDLTKLTLDPWYTGLVPLPGTLDIVCTTIWAARVFDPHGKSCCYNTTTSLWVQDRPYAGSFFSNHPVTHSKQHELNDLNAKTYCCNGSNLCEKYYELRPIGDCYRETWFGFGTFWGDPHFRTLDNKDFTFNGLGEYHLLQVEKKDRLFQLQARTERASKPDGTLSNATVFSAFAAYDDGDGAKFQVELQNKTGFVVYGNNVDISLGIRQDNYTYQAPEGNLLITKRGETVLVLFPVFGISLNVTINIRTFSIVVLINSTFAGQTRGLLGNFNGNPDDDFVLPNGSVLDSNMTEREIFDYGQQWSVNKTTTVFDYPRGKSHADFHVENHEPEFLDEASAEKRNIAEQFCSGGRLGYSSNDIKQCIFDLVFTDDEDFANQTLITEDISVRDQKEINSKIPNLEGCDVIRGDLDDFLSCKLNISEDPDELNFTVSGLDNFTLSEDGTLTFKHDDSDSVKVSVTNNDGKISPEVTLNFFLCNGCSGNGVCSDDESRGDDSETEFFKLARCICYTGYDGPDCEFDFDGCASKPCSLHRNCTDLSPDEHQQQNKPFECGPCPDGYIDLPTDKDKCVDKNECLENDGGCEQVCTNTDGGYECSCWTGYRQNTNNPSACSDVNECDEALHQCEHTCINTDGDYICACKQGFTLQSNIRTCLKDDIDVCSDSLIDCSEADGCTVDENGNASCFCNNGFALSEDFICEDIDECAASVCPQDCENTDGSFVCICYIGYELTETTTCTPCSFPTWGDDCANTCDCPDAIRCDPVKGCICRTGWTGTQCDEDINECQTLTDPCPNVLEKCINTNGSYYCGCITGYQRLEGSDQNCKDIDECSSALLHDCQPSVAICNNAIGGYTCSCTQGYKELNATHCEDIDECELRIAGCEHDCENFYGSFNCYCQFGYILLEDRKSCEEDENPCLMDGLNCTQVCITDVDNNATRCGCSPGFELEEDNLTCSDIKECENATLNKCEGNAECKNEVGSYHCECSVGYKLQNDRRTCTECDQFHYGINCSNTCNCIRGVCNKITGCICDEGWFGPDCDMDINECRMTEDLCLGDLLECVNTLGSYSCESLSGYQLIDEICTDIDECKSSDTNDCDQICDNTVGGYLCRCQPGFIRGNDSCENIKECDLQHDCEQNCQDTVGSYRCSCRSGFSLDLRNRKSCTPETECNETLTTYCNVRNGDCLLTEGEPDCVCWKGYQKNEDTGDCEDIDECLDDRCDQNCVNLNGNYSCTCNIGYQLDADLVTCTECLPFYYGQGCSEECICVRKRTDFCYHIDGLCNCKQGWRSEDCSIDIDECKDDEQICNIQPNSHCVNKMGSYKCVCNDGFYAWDNSCIDRNECQEDVDNCMQICENTEGSFYCDCFMGYYLNGSSCLDQDECQEGVDDCMQECVNTEGGFICNCSRGYYINGSSCIECDDNTFGYNCSEQCPCNTTNSVVPEQSCDRVDGNCSCSEGWTDVNCTTDVDVCLMKMTLCTDVPNTYCHNEDGGYSCRCSRGYVNNSNNQCVPVLPGTASNSTDPCVVYETLFGNCESGTTCQVENNVPICKSDDVADNFGVIIAASMGGFVGIVLLILLVLCMPVLWKKRELKRKQKRMQKHMVTEEPGDIETIDGNSMAASNMTFDSTFDMSNPMMNVSRGTSGWNLVQSWQSIANGSFRQYMLGIKKEHNGEGNSYKHQHASVFKLPRPKLGSFVPRIIEQQPNNNRYQHDEVEVIPTTRVDINQTDI